jgi:hypothetical protein
MDFFNVHSETPHRTQIRHLGKGQCRLHGLLRQGAREQGRHRAAAAPAVQPQRPRGGAHDERPSAIVVVEAGDLGRPPRASAEATRRADRPPPASRGHQQRGVGPGRQGRRRAEQVRAAAAVPATAEPTAIGGPAPWRRPPPPAPRWPIPAPAPTPSRAWRWRRPTRPACAEAPPRPPAAREVRLAAEQRPGESPKPTS